jgi:hypothetical protein
MSEAQSERRARYESNFRIWQAAHTALELGIFGCTITGGLRNHQQFAYANIATLPKDR